MSDDVAEPHTPQGATVKDWRAGSRALSYSAPTSADACFFPQVWRQGSRGVLGGWRGHRQQHGSGREQTESGCW